MATTKSNRRIGNALSSLNETPAQKVPPTTPTATVRNANDRAQAAGRRPNPRYQDLEAKTARLHPGQMEELDRLAKKISDQERRAGRDLPARITGNTLIRVAVDALIAQQASLAGGTEAELLRSLTN